MTWCFFCDDAFYLNSHNIKNTNFVLFWLYSKTCKIIIISHDTGLLSEYCSGINKIQRCYKDASVFQPVNLNFDYKIIFGHFISFNLPAIYRYFVKQYHYP